MEGYLGETVLDIEDTRFKHYTPTDWAMHFIERYGQIDGSHHKQWVLDQVARILNGTKVIIKIASWKNGEFEYRISLDEPSQKYLDWVEEMKGEDDEYSYDEGINP